jgi:hypothetical protein
LAINNIFHLNNFADISLGLIEKLIGQMKESKYIKKRYLQMILSSTIDLNKNRIEVVNESLKRQGSPIRILDR